MPTLTFALLLSQASITQPAPQGLLDDSRLAAAFAEIAGSPRARVETIGRTHEGRPIQMAIVARPEVLSELERHRRRAAELAGPGIVREGLGPVRIVEREITALLRGTALPVLFAGASWGHEASTVEGLVAAARALALDETETVRSALSGTIALIVPLMNPDGRAAALREWEKTPRSNGDAGMGNAWGFLINRDFVHATQPESQAMVETLLAWRPVVAVDHHEDGYNLGVRLEEVSFVEPFVSGFDVEEHPASRDAIAAAGGAIAARWRELGFRVLYNPRGDDTFAPMPGPVGGINPVAGSAGRLNLMASLHGVTSFITESARTPESQSWEDRVKQKSSAILALLSEVSANPARYARALYERRLDRLREIADRFVLIPIRGQPRDGLERLLALLRVHGIEVYRVEAPNDAFVVPLAQPEGEMAQHLLAPLRSRLNEAPPALGLTAIPSEALGESERAALRAAGLLPALLPLPAPPGRDGIYRTAPTLRATALVNHALSSGSARVSRSTDHYLIEGGASALGWLARQAGGELIPEDAGARGIPVPAARVALYAGQGVTHQDWGEVAWALEQGGFRYRLVNESNLASDLNGATALVIPNGSAKQIASGWSDASVTRRAPWEPSEPARGLEGAGFDAIRRFVDGGGIYVGIGGGGAALAGGAHLGLSAARTVPAAVGLGQVRLAPSLAGSPLLFGFDASAPIPAYFVAPPGGPDDGFVFEAEGGVVAGFAGAGAYERERSFTSNSVLSREASHAAIVHERRGRGHVVLFGIEPTFRGQWPNTARLLYNALLLAAGS